MTDITSIEAEQYSEPTVFVSGVTAPVKSAGKRLASRLNIALDVLITGTATVNLYASNIEDNGPTGTKWGAPLRTFSASEKVIIEGEPWLFWMVEVAAVSGTVTVVGAA
jgi:hypothetical protein